MIDHTYVSLGSVVSREQLETLKKEYAKLVELQKDAFLHKSIWDYHYDECVIQLRHEKAALTVRKQLEYNLELMREAEASIQLEIAQNEE